MGLFFIVSFVRLLVFIVDWGSIEGLVINVRAHTHAHIHTNHTYLNRLIARFVLDVGAGFVRLRSARIRRAGLPTRGRHHGDGSFRRALVERRDRQPERTVSSNIRSTVPFIKHKYFYSPLLPYIRRDMHTTPVTDAQATRVRRKARIDHTIDIVKNTQTHTYWPS